MPSWKWKNNAVQELTATIIPPSTVIVMSNEEDCHFQCQEPGHVAWHCPHIRCYECNEYGHIIMDCSHRIPPSGTPAAHHKAHKGHHGTSSLRHHHEDQDRWSWSRSQSHYPRHCSSSHCNLHRSHCRSQHWNRGIHHRGSSQQSPSAHRGTSHRPCCYTQHQSHCRSSTHHSSMGDWSWDCSRSHSRPSYQSSRHESLISDSYSSRTRRRPHPKKNMEVKIEDPHTDHYSLDDHSSESGEESDPLN